MTEHLPPGFRAAAVDAAIKKKDRLDLALVVTDAATPARAVWTRNLVQAAPVIVSRDHLVATGGNVRAILINSGCANCATGQQGLDAARRSAELVASALDCRAEEVLVFSTGVIGAQLPVDRIAAAIPRLLDRLTPAGFVDASRAIMTTDTRAKRVARELALPDGTGILAGMAKGAGMIHPDLATMLGFLFTDMVPTSDMGIFLRAACDRSFNALTIDGDTSTNDAVLLWSSGARRITPGDDEVRFLATLEDAATELARMIARDGEGAQHLVVVEVSGAPSSLDARAVARTIATSPLVKTALHGCDPNWGRILAAAGRAGVLFDPQRARVGIGDAVLFDADGPHPEHEPAAHAHMKGEEVRVWIDLGAGAATARAFTCDFSADYVKINADYRS